MFSVLAYPCFFPQSAFTVDSATGSITVNQRLDRETMETAKLVITVLDMHAPPGSPQTATGNQHARTHRRRLYKGSVYPRIQC